MKDLRQLDTSNFTNPLDYRPTRLASLSGQHLPMALVCGGAQASASDQELANHKQGQIRAQNANQHSVMNHVQLEEGDPYEMGQHANAPHIHGQHLHHHDHAHEQHQHQQQYHAAQQELAIFDGYSANPYHHYSYAPMNDHYHESEPARELCPNQQQQHHHHQDHLHQHQAAASELKSLVPSEPSAWPTSGTELDTFQQAQPAQLPLLASHSAAYIDYHPETPSTCSIRNQHYSEQRLEHELKSSHQRLAEQACESSAQETLSHGQQIPGAYLQVNSSNASGTTSCTSNNDWSNANSINEQRSSGKKGSAKHAERLKKTKPHGIENEEVCLLGGDEICLNDSRVIIRKLDKRDEAPIELTNDDLVSLAVKDLNKLLVGFCEAAVKRIKLRRRTLKNRGYARQCRMKRADNKETLEKKNQELYNNYQKVLVELEKIKSEKAKMDERYKEIEEKYKILLSSRANNLQTHPQHQSQAQPQQQQQQHPNQHHLQPNQQPVSRHDNATCSTRNRSSLLVYQRDYFRSEQDIFQRFNGLSKSESSK